MRIKPNGYTTSKHKKVYGKMYGEFSSKRAPFILNSLVEILLQPRFLDKSVKSLKKLTVNGAKQLIAFLTNDPMNSPTCEQPTRMLHECTQLGNYQITCSFLLAHWCGHSWGHWWAGSLLVTFWGHSVVQSWEISFRHSRVQASFKRYTLIAVVKREKFYLCRIDVHEV